MAELLDPFEREIRRTRSQVPLSPNLQRSFDDDMGRALAEFEARTGTARTYAPLQPGDEAAGIIAREAPRNTKALTIGEMIANPVREPENPEAVRQELIDPLMGAYGMDRLSSGRSAPASRTYKVKNESGGDSVIMTDPLTGQSREVFSTPGKPVQDPRKMVDYRAAVKRVSDARKAFERATRESQRAALQKEVDDSVSALLKLAPTEEAPVSKPAAPVQAAPTPQIFMGDPLQRPAAGRSPKRLKWNTQTGEFE
jgi:hypothetical protein